MKLIDESEMVCKAAIKAADLQKSNWNRTFFKAVEKAGYRLIPITYTYPQPAIDVMVAPPPVRNQAWSYPYPCVVAPVGWVQV